ncbi:hypothetical protein GJ698_22100 [Pseudoduganella sp. FT26W]|uniref:DUF2158 domain-containing protein n=1 Tax=Duganella aquatilis TaxID=2666082 RepID=A0A844D118_9BURK|nr:hypothetical protein [Duganella aquatilis]MRW86767.1 hypothetical protein [Duganella aquatilis]
MTDGMKTAQPRDNDLVRMIGDKYGAIMRVTCSDLGDEHNWEGVRNGIYCEWVVNGELRFEVFRKGQLEIVSSSDAEI